MIKKPHFRLSTFSRRASSIFELWHSSDHSLSVTSYLLECYELRHWGRFKRALHTCIPLGTRPSQSRTPAPHVADLRLLARRTGTVWRIDTTLPLKRIESLYEGDISLHGFRDSVPIRCIQRSSSGPGDVVGVASRVFVAIGGPAG